MNVVLPAPFGPISACRAPGANVSETSLFASNAPQRLDSPWVRSAQLIAMLRARACARLQRVEPAEDAAAREQHDDDQEEADPELPVHGIDAGQVVLRDHEDRRADEAAVQAAGAAQHQHDHQLGRARKAERVDADELRRLREQRAGDAGDRRRDREDRAQPPRAPARRSPASACRLRGCRAGSSPNGELTRRRDQQEHDEHDDERVDDTRFARRYRIETGRGSGRSSRRSGPSTPPVTECALLAASHSIRPMPSVTISRVRSPPRTTRKLTR